MGLIRHCSPPLRWPLARYGRITLLLLGPQRRQLDDHGGSGFAPDRYMGAVVLRRAVPDSAGVSTRRVCRPSKPSVWKRASSAQLPPCRLRRGDRINCQLLQCMSPVMALFGRRKRTQQCLLLGEKRTRAGRHSTSANDPERTSGRKKPTANSALRRGDRFHTRARASHFHVGVAACLWENWRRPANSSDPPRRRDPVRF